MPPKLRAALYDRVSTDEQHEGKLRAQLRTHAARIGARVALDVEEVGSGAGPLPERARVLDAARRGLVDVVICWNVDRWGRDPFDVQATVRELQQRAVRWIAVNDGFDFRPDDDSDGTKRDFFVIASVFGGMARRRLRENTRLGIAAARRRGAKIGRPRVLTAELCADVATLRAEGLSLRAIAATLGIGRGTVALALEPSDAQLAQLDNQLSRSRAAYNAAARPRVSEKG